MALETRLTLIARVRDVDDEGAWREFVDLYTPIIFSFLLKRGLSQADGEDVTQEVFRALARALPGFELDRGIGTFRNWLYTVTRSKLNSFLARSRRVDVPVEQVPDSLDTADWDELYFKELFVWACEVVKGEVDELSWEVFWRTAVELESPAKLAKEMGLKLDNVYQKRSRVGGRIRRAIRECDETV